MTSAFFDVDRSVHTMVKTSSPPTPFIFEQMMEAAERLAAPPTPMPSHVFMHPRAICFLRIKVTPTQVRLTSRERGIRRRLGQLWPKLDLALLQRLADRYAAPH